MNFAHLISQFGMIPNGGRCYYVNRSQPPLFIQMVKEYEKASGDTNFVKSIMHLMVEEFNYWQSNHLGQNLLLFLTDLLPFSQPKIQQTLLSALKLSFWNRNPAMCFMSANLCLRVEKWQDELKSHGFVWTSDRIILLTPTTFLFNFHYLLVFIFSYIDPLFL